MSQVVAGPQQEGVEGRENLFRELDADKALGWKIVGLVMLLFGVATNWGRTNPIAIALMLVASAALVYAIVAPLTLKLPLADPDRYMETVRLAAERLPMSGCDALRLDFEEDVLQSVVVFGGAMRPLIQGRRRTIFGVKPNTMKHWVPWAPHPNGSIRMYGTYQYHAFFALEDSVAFHTRYFDVITNQWLPHVASNQVFYRHIENVRLDNNGFTLETVGSRSHFIPLTVNQLPPSPAGTVDAKDQAQRVAHELDPVMLNAGTQFVNAVNRLRGEWEVRQRP